MSAEFTLEGSPLIRGDADGQRGIGKSEQF